MVILADCQSVGCSDIMVEDFPQATRSVQDRHQPIGLYLVWPTNFSVPYSILQSVLVARIALALENFPHKNVRCQPKI